MSSVAKTALPIGAMLAEEGSGGRREEGPRRFRDQRKVCVVVTGARRASCVGSVGRKDYALGRARCWCVCVGERVSR